MTEIYKIIIHKSKVVNDLTNFKDFKETKQNFIIINHPLGHFEKGSIKKVKIEEGYIYLGNLKPKFKSLEGSGILSRFLTKTKDKIIDVFSPRLNDYNNNTKRMMAKYGHEQVVSMAIYRTPLPSMLNKIINVVSFGKWEELKKKYGFDKFFHLALVLTLKTHKNIIVEKNEVINVSDSYKTNSDTEVLPIDDYKTPLTVNYLLEKTRKAFKNDALYFGYDPLTNNCQVFIKTILQANGLYNSTINNFLFQDIEELTKELSPLTKGIMRGTTNLAGTVNKLRGQGKKKGKGIVEDVLEIPYVEEENKKEDEKEDIRKLIHYIKSKYPISESDKPFTKTGSIKNYEPNIFFTKLFLYTILKFFKKHATTAFYGDTINVIDTEDLMNLNNNIEDIFENAIKDDEDEEDDTRLIIIPLDLGEHSNVLILNIEQKTLERYEPHGYFTANDERFSGDIDKELEKISKKLGLDYIEPSESCPTDLSPNTKIKGFQRENSDNYCLSWSMFFVLSRLIAPNEKRRDLLDFIKDNLGTNLKLFISSFAKFLLTNSIDLIKEFINIIEKKKITDEEKDDFFAYIGYDLGNNNIENYFKKYKKGQLDVVLKKTGKIYDLFTQFIIKKFKSLEN